MVSGHTDKVARGSLHSSPPPTADRFQLDIAQLTQGAAFAAHAIGAHLTDIRYAGGWSTNLTVLESKYIDFTMQPSEGARLFFGFLLKPYPREDVASPSTPSDL